MDRKKIYIIVLILSFLGCNKSEVNENFFFGDSHIDRWDLNYYFPDKKNNNLGKGGETILQLTEYFNNNKKKINSCYVEIGTNDCLHYINSDEPIDTVYNTITQRYKDLFQLLNKNTSKCYIISLIPIKKPTESTYINDLQIRINNFIKNYLNQFNNLHFINVFDKLKNEENFINPDYTLDGVHLNKDGYDLISTCLLPYV